ncbi:hypothetical protein J437_LFUL018691 [Ladona fulva]|uniref:Uncharacterized protein n=1 Tax=Ladona fulva TaxID=123851 RepID=A0A8K0KRZ8_LADFU|nr:hypothetical protein J437_LFUL018691 [Ladona fulva]
MTYNAVKKNSRRGFVMEIRIILQETQMYETSKELSISSTGRHGGEELRWRRVDNKRRLRAKAAGKDDNNDFKSSKIRAKNP